MASTEASSSANDCIGKCPYHESSSHSSTETVPNTPESSTSTDQECQTRVIVSCTCNACCDFHYNNIVINQHNIDNVTHQLFDFCSLVTSHHLHGLKYQLHIISLAVK